MRILFVHIPKTGGMSLYSALEGWATPARSMRFGLSGPAELERYRTVPDARLRELRLLAGHLAYVDFMRRDLTGWHPITVLRNPVERMLSDYTFVRETRGHPWHEEVRSMELDFFIDWFASRTHSADQQCRLISGAPDADAAFEALRSRFLLAATVERLPVFATVLAGHLGTTLQLLHEHASVERIDAATLDEQTVERIRDFNRQDDSLYRRVLAAGFVGYGSPGDGRVARSAPYGQPSPPSR
jgi:hypothetical protein